MDMTLTLWFHFTQIVGGKLSKYIAVPKKQVTCIQAGIPFITEHQTHLAQECKIYEEPDFQATLQITQSKQAIKKFGSSNHRQRCYVIITTYR